LEGRRTNASGGSKFHADCSARAYHPGSPVNKPRVGRPASLNQISLSRALPGVRLPMSAARKPRVVFGRPKISLAAALSRKR
jgi:hypothetical protein